jgi:hypothetical protein
LSSYTIEIRGLEGLNQFNLGEIAKTALINTSNTEGKTLYNEINNNTRVRTGRLKRGNMMQISDLGFHYWNNVPYAGFMDTKNVRGNRFMTAAFEKRKASIIKRMNDEVTKGIVSYFASKHKI